jgi:transcriptional regulator with XRE-family HTH domain
VPDLLNRRTVTEDARTTMIGPVGRGAIANIEELRKARGLSLRDLAAKMAETGRPVGDTVLHRQSQGRRRIDADDLVAFAAVLGVTPARLLAPPEAAAAEDHPAVRAARVLADRLAGLLAADGPEAASRARSQVRRALRRTWLEADELLDGEAV